MDPFNDLNSEPAVFTEENIIEMWVDPADPNARNKNTYLSGWNISKTEKKEHLKKITKYKGVINETSPETLHKIDLNKLFDIQFYQPSY